MKLTSTRPPGVFWVDWWLMNHCSWQCSYCADIIRNGTIPTPALADCVKFLTDLNDHARAQGRRINISFTGGEVTEWPQLADLLDHAHKLDMITSIRTNAHCDLDLWQKITESVTHINMLFHPEHSQTSKFLLSLKTAADKSRSLRVTLNMLPDRFQELLDLEQTILNRWPSIPIDRHMLFEDTARNTKPQQYTQEQQELMTHQWGDIVIEDQSTKTYTDFQTLVLQKKNQFKGAECWAGLDQLIVDAWGKVFRSHCRQWGSLGHIGGEIRWPTAPMTCMKNQCANGFDILATKQLTS